MSGELVYSVCGMCSVRCPIQVELEDGQCRFVQGNRHAPFVKGALCPRGAAGLALLRDDQRPQFPLLRQGARGEGQWRRVSWPEALDRVAEAIAEARGRRGGAGLLWSDCGGPFADPRRALVRALGSPNWIQRSPADDLNRHHAARAVFGLGAGDLAPDLAQARLVVLAGRNLCEAIDLPLLNQLIAGREAGGRLWVVDVRATVTAAKADRFLLIRPGGDYALNLAVLNRLLARGLPGPEAAGRLDGLAALRERVAACDPAFAAERTGLPAAAIEELVDALLAAAPRVVWLPGGTNGRYRDSLATCQSAWLINALLGAVGQKGGLALAATPERLGRPGLRRLADGFPKAAGPRLDGAGTSHPQLDPALGSLPLALAALGEEGCDPPGVYLAYQDDPLGTLPDPPAQEARLDRVGLLVAITSQWHATAWRADVVLPLSTYLERESALGQVAGLHPCLLRRARAVAPRFDTRADWEIVAGLAERLGLRELAFASPEELWREQLAESGLEPGAFAETGLVELAPGPVRIALAEGCFPTPSGRIEAGGLPAPLPPAAPPAGAFRLVVGEAALQGEGTTVNNPLLQARLPENRLWINAGVARGLGIGDGDEVEVANRDRRARLQARLSEFIHPEAVFMVQGFGVAVPALARACGRGAAANRLMAGGLAWCDPLGGEVAAQETWVTLRRPGDAA